MLKSLLSGLIGLLFAFNAHAGSIEIEDLAGRKISIETPVDRIALSEGRYITALSILNPDNPVQGIVGMMTPLGFTHPQMQDQLFAKFPEARNIPLFGSRSADTVSVEKIIELNPQVAILGLGDHGPGAKAKEIINLLEASGTKIVFIDFRLDPMYNTIPSMRILGEIFGQESRAEKYIADYENRLQTIKTRVAAIAERPKVFLQVHAGRRECCWGMAEGMLGPFIEFAGGENIADAVAPGPTVQHTAEFLLIENPDVWIATASGWLEEFNNNAPAVTVGPGMTQDMAQESLSKYLATAEFWAMDAIQQGRAHAFWHNFYNSPFNILVLEALAKWLHPEAFSDIDPDESMAELYREFMPFELDGVYFTTYKNDK